MPDALPQLTIACFGPPMVRVGGDVAPPEVMWRKNLALLVYLAFSPGRTRSREHLLGLLWPEKDEARARHSLNEAVRRLRGALGAERLVSTGDAITLNDENLTFDAGSDTVPEERGRFLDGLTLTDAPAFEDWLTAERAAHRDRRRDRLIGDGERAVARSLFGDAQTAVRQALAIDPFSEPAVRILMQSAALTGDVAGGLRAFHEFAERLRSELGEDPSRELSALAGRLRDARWRRMSAGQIEMEVPLVGRDAVHELTFTTLRRAMASGAQALVVEGDGGSGKTRLLTECGNRWMLDGGIVIRARPLAGDTGSAWSALRQLVRGGLQDAPGLTGASPDALGVLAGVVPELATRFPARPALDRAQVAQALADVLRAIAEEIPLALALDDGHHADGATVQAVVAALAECADLSLALIVSTAPVARQPESELARLQAEIGRRLSGVTLRLEPLDRSAIQQLVNVIAPWCTGTEGQDRLARRLAFETSGNALLVVTLLRGLQQHADLRRDALVWPPPQQTYQAPVPIEVPALLRAVTVARVAALEASGREVLVTACVAGRHPEVDVLATVMGLATETVEKELEELERHAFVVFDGERYEMPVPIVAQVVTTEFLTPGQRRRLEKRFQEARQ